MTNNWASLSESRRLYISIVRYKNGYRSHALPTINVLCCEIQSKARPTMLHICLVIIIIILFTLYQCIFGAPKAPLYCFQK